MKTVKYGLIVLLVFNFVGCSSRQDFTMKESSTATEPAQINSDVISKASNVGGGGGGEREDKPISLDVADKSKVETTERKIIRNAELTLEASSPDEASANITKVVENKGGFVVESQKQTSDAKATKSDSMTMTVRVPSAKFEESLDEIRKLSGRVITEIIKGQDVTEEFIDIEARLKTKKALEAQFLEIMKQGKTVEDALSVQRELADVRGEIEQIEGKKRFLENQSSLSTIKLRLQTPTTFSANSTGFFYQLGQAFTNGFDFAVNFILGLVTFIIAILPFLLFIALPVYLILRYFWRRVKKVKSYKKIVEEELKDE